MFYLVTGSSLLHRKLGPGFGGSHLRKSIQYLGHQTTSLEIYKMSPLLGQTLLRDCSFLACDQPTANDVTEDNK